MWLIIVFPFSVFSVNEHLKWNCEIIVFKWQLTDAGVWYLYWCYVMLWSRSITELPICHIINLSLEKCVCPLDWKIAKIDPISKNNKEPVSSKNSPPISLHTANLWKDFHLNKFRSISLQTDEEKRWLVYLLLLLFNLSWIVTLNHLLLHVCILIT